MKLRSNNQQLYCVTETKERNCIKIEFNSQKNLFFLPQHGRHFFVVSFNMAAVTSTLYVILVFYFVYGKLSCRKHFYSLFTSD